jgi:hypothetical protein
MFDSGPLSSSKTRGGGVPRRTGQSPRRYAVGRANEPSRFQFSGRRSSGVAEARLITSPGIALQQLGQWRSIGSAPERSRGPHRCVIEQVSTRVVQLGNEQPLRFASVRWAVAIKQSIDRQRRLHACGIGAPARLRLRRASAEFAANWDRKRQDTRPRAQSRGAANAAGVNSRYRLPATGSGSSASSRAMYLRTMRICCSAIFPALHSGVRQLLGVEAAVKL